MFVNRETELGFLREHLDCSEPSLLVIYGRRRTGKTELINRYMETDGQDVFSDRIYYLADERGTEPNVDRFAEKASEALDDVKPDADGFDDVFEYIVGRTESCLVVIDEFSYLVENDDSVPSTFQLVWDEILQKDEPSVSLVLLGSSISMMEEGVLSYESPLYGRRTGQWKLTPLSFKHTSEFFAGYGFEDRVRGYAVLGGVPAYLEKFDPDTGLFDNIESRVLSKGSFLYEEPEFLLRQELREPSTYMSALESMASGSTTVTEIANDIGRDASGMSRYLQNLRRLEIVDRVTPVTANRDSRGVYEIADNFFRFWFRFVYPRLDSLERGSTSESRRAVEEGIDTYTGRIFEDVCRQAVYEDGFGFGASSVGRWWYKEDEIDLVALDEEKDRILFGECKWTESRVGEPLLRNLKEKSNRVRWRDGNRKEVYVLFSRAGFTKEVMEEARDDADFMLWNASELQEVFDT